MSQKTGLFVINLGTPDAPTEGDVKRYLSEFLMDPYVIDIPYIFRSILVKGIIAPTRSKKSAENYKKIWTDQGSPLKVLTQQLTDSLAEQLGSDWVVKMGMRYQNPSLQSVMEQFKKEGIEDVYVWTLYPQFADSTVTTTVENLKELNKGLKLRLHLLPEFYAEDFFIKSLAHSLRGHQFDHLIMSYHGLPFSHLKKTEGERGYCAEGRCCETINSKNRKCYRAQCVQTSRMVAKYNVMDASEYSISFQSRLGKNRWLEPSTESTVKKLAQKGVKRVAVVCPAFVVDGLETLEEISEQMREIFIEHGGKELFLIPCLNSEPQWVQRVADWVRSSPKTQMIRS